MEFYTGFDAIMTMLMMVILTTLTVWFGYKMHRTTKIRLNTVMCDEMLRLQAEIATVKQQLMTIEACVEKHTNKLEEFSANEGSTRTLVGRTQEALDGAMSEAAATLRHEDTGHLFAAGNSLLMKLDAEITDSSYELGDSVYYHPGTEEFHLEPCEGAYLFGRLAARPDENGNILVFQGGACDG